VDSIIVNTNAQLGRRATPGGRLSFYMGLLLLPDRAPLAAAGVDVDSVIRTVAARIRAVPGVARADSPAALSRADTAADPVARRWHNDLSDDADVALVVTLRPYAIWSSQTLGIAMHGQPSDFDTHVPLLMWGQGIRPGTYPGRVGEVDLAPTLASLLALTPTERVDGRVLVEALERTD
jgi:hypothetical protein